MKKFTFLLSLLLASSGVTASAQDARSWVKLSADANLANAVTDLSTLTDGGTYAFYNVNNSKYITIDNFDNLHFGRAASLTASNAESGLAVFRFHITKNGENTTYTFETAIGGQYMPAAANNNNSGGATATSTPASFVIQNHTTGANPTTKTDGQFVIKNENGDLSFDMGGDDTNQFCGWEGKGANCWYKIVPVEISTTKAYSVPYVTTDNAGNTVTCLSGRKTLTEGETFATPIVPYYYSLSADQTNYVVSVDNCRFTYKVSKTGDAPVEFSTDNNKVWYTLKTRNSDGNYLVRQADNIIRSGGMSGLSKYDATCITSLDLLDGGLWAFVEDGVAVKLLNKQNGKYLRVNGTGNQANFNGEASKFYFQKITPKDGFTADFSLQYAATSFLGDHSTYQGTPLLATYDNAEAYKDNGSAFIAKKIDLNSTEFITLAKESVTAEITAATASDESNGEIVTQTADALSTAKTAVASATSYDAIVTAHANAFKYPANIDANAYYQIISQSVNNKGVRINKANISSENMVVNKNGVLEAGEKGSRIIRRTTASDALVPQMWQLVANADGSYKIKNANTNCCIGQIVSNGTAVEMPINNDGAGNYVITKGKAANKFLLKDGSNLLNAYGGDNNTIIANYNDANDNGSNWVIKKVTTVPVSITDAKYATVAFPFATKVATADVKAYYATGAADGMITLVEYPEGIIPANQGALLYNEAGATTANLEIVTTDKAVEGNKLMPATAKRAGFEADATYVLAKNAAGEAAFLKNSLTVVPANKAYVDAETIPADNNGSNVLNFNFGQVTGINGVVAADKAGVQYFDLQGRRVLYPAHGIFVTNTGKKVFVK
nr:MAG TPA: Endo-1,5-alpha-L-arabinanase [Caudoviricetes sp.]